MPEPHWLGQVVAGESSGFGTPSPEFPDMPPCTFVAQASKTEGFDDIEIIGVPAPKSTPIKDAVTPEPYNISSGAEGGGSCSSAGPMG